MDSMIAKLIVSREKSIKVLVAEVEKLESLANSSKVAVAAASLRQVVAVKRQRLEKLEAELAGLREAGRQQELVAVDPTVRKGK